jgi:hypothetical protein
MNGVFLTGASGIEYFYTPYLFAETAWHADPANYAFAHLDDTGAWQLVYIGETANLLARMRTHAQWQAAQRLGCTYVLVNLNAEGVRVRRVQERDLVARYRPVLNTQLLRDPKPRVRRMGYYPGG